MTDKLTYLKQLKTKSIHFIRDVAAEFENLAMLYSVRKGSGAMLHLAMKAFYPASRLFRKYRLPPGNLMK